jgi:hypothetical protein
MTSEDVSNLSYFLRLFDVAILQNEITGEHTCIVLRPLQSDDVEGVAGVSGGWLNPFNQGVSPNILCNWCFLYVSRYCLTYF